VIRSRCHPTARDGKVNPDINPNLFPNPNLLFSDYNGQILKVLFRILPYGRKVVDIDRRKRVGVGIHRVS